MRDGKAAILRIQYRYRLIRARAHRIAAGPIARNVELRYADGTLISIYTVGVENEVAEDMYQRSELDRLIYADPVGYADLILNGDPVAYLREVTEYKRLD